jgi:DNA adenine methylase
MSNVQTLQKHTRCAENEILGKPVLKWAGGKNQLLSILTKTAPKKYRTYIEPFLGGGALFFSLNPYEAVISDSNPELINVYTAIAHNVELVIKNLRKHINERNYFYEIRSLKWDSLSSEEAAARTIYLNRTCFNGLFRVNKKGHFNVPFGNYKNPKICDADNLRNVSKLLKNVTITCGDYKSVLATYAKPEDFIYLDPPYLPISKYSDFKRYTKEQFYEEDHRELAEEVTRLHELGCHVILTNSNHLLIHELYDRYKLDVFQTKRNINCHGSKRIGEDVVVTINPKRRVYIKKVPELLPEQVRKFPPTRYMGSKSKILSYLRDIIRQFKCGIVLDLFSGSGIVSYMLKAEGKKVISNDYMAMCATYAKAMIENNNTQLSRNEAETLFKHNRYSDKFVQTVYKGLYYSDDDNQLIDNIRANLKGLGNQYKVAIAKSALIRACIKKRPRGIFTYIGNRYDDGRQDIHLSFKEHFLKAASIINESVFDNGKLSRARCGDAMTIKVKPDLVYIDPPYYSPHSDNEYVRRYHFVEGIARDWNGIDIQWHTKTRKFKNYPTPFSTRNGAHNAFDKMFQKFNESILIISYSSNSLPTLDEMLSLISKHKRHVELISIDHRYSFGNQGHKQNNNNNKVLEYLFVAY